MALTKITTGLLAAALTLVETEQAEAWERHKQFLIDNDIYPEE